MLNDLHNVIDRASKWWSWALNLPLESEFIAIILHLISYFADCWYTHSHDTVWAGVQFGWGNVLSARGRKWIWHVPLCEGVHDYWWICLGLSGEASGWILGGVMFRLNWPKKERRYSRKWWQQSKRTHRLNFGKPWMPSEGVLGSTVRSVGKHPMSVNSNRIRFF